MSSRKKQFEILFDGMQPYMLSVENMLKYSQGESLQRATEQRSKNVTRKADFKVKKPVDPVFYPRQSDSLFWCFYTIVFGREAYELVRSDAFKVEKEFKIGSVEKLRAKADQLKTYKLKKNAVENELVNEQRIGIDGLRALCIAHEVSLMYVVGRTYYLFQHGDENTHVIVKNVEKNWCGLRGDDMTEYMASVEADYFWIENPLKPLKGISGYTISQLQELCRRLGLSVLDETGKKVSKKVMYESILTKL